MNKYVDSFNIKYHLIDLCTIRLRIYRKINIIIDFTYKDNIIIDFYEF